MIDVFMLIFKDLPADPVLQIDFSVDFRGRLLFCYCFATDLGVF